MSALQEWGVVDVFKVWSDYKNAKMNSANNATINDLKNQMSMMTGIMQGYAGNILPNIGATGANGLSQVATGNQVASLMPWVIVAGIVVAGVYVLKK